MEILKLNRQILRAFGMCSLGEKRAFWLKCVQLLGVFSILINFSSLVGFSLLYIAEHYQMGDLDQNLFVVIQVIGSFPSIASFISLVYRMTSVRDFLDKIQKIFDQCNWVLYVLLSLFFDWLKTLFFSDENISSAKIYERENELCEKFIKWTLIFILSGLYASTLVPIVVGALFYYVRDGYVETTKLYLPLKMKWISTMIAR